MHFSNASASVCHIAVMVRNKIDCIGFKAEYSQNGKTFWTKNTERLLGARVSKHRTTVTSFNANISAPDRNERRPLWPIAGAGLGVALCLAWIGFLLFVLVKMIERAF
jgi:hypothetical protein